jgi:hypothetical protein
MAIWSDNFKKMGTQVAENEVTQEWFVFDTFGPFPYYPTQPVSTFGYIHQKG